MMIWATEVGDKTFFIAAIMAMRNDRLAVYVGAISALAVMTVLSALMGLVLPNFIPKKYTAFAGACLFAYFGVKLLWDARSMGEG
jgi:putative Ca2+/H+ antiporter (TMEM165/GDT1 family)